MTPGASGSTGDASPRRCSIASRSSKAARRICTETAPWAASISFFSRPLAPGASPDRRRWREPRCPARLRRRRVLPIAGALTANVSGDYQDGGGYVLLDPASRARSTSRPQIIQRNAYARLSYAPSSTWSAFVDRPPVRRQPRDRARRSPTRTATRRTSTSASTTARTPPAPVGARLGWPPGRDRSARRRSAPAAAVAEDSSVTAVIPSHDWGASAIWTRSGHPQPRVVQRRRRLPPHERRLR